MRPTFALLALMAALFTIGCAPKATFDVSITNQTQDPITVGIVKDGQPYEFDLAGPEQWAVESPLDSLPPWGHVIPPGRTMDSGKITGAFPRGSAAYLRVYRGRHDNAGLIAISNPSPNRAEVLIFPTHNDVVVRDEKSRLIADRVRPTPR